MTNEQRMYELERIARFVAGLLDSWPSFHGYVQINFAGGRVRNVNVHQSYLLDDLAAAAPSDNN